VKTLIAAILDKALPAGYTLNRPTVLFGVFVQSRKVLNMKSIFRVYLAAIVLSSVLIVGGLVVHHSTAKACGSYMVAGSEVDTYLLTSDINTSFSVWLMYNSCNGTNWGHLSIQGYLNYSLTVYVERASGSDGGDQVEHSAADCGQMATCDSPTVYSPHNKARAYFILTSNADVQYFWAYTSWF
jgi:hypothetical protein